MRQAVCYLSHTGKAFQQPLNCLKFEFDHLVADFHVECQALILHPHARKVFEARLATIRDRLAMLEAKAQEFYALRESLNPKPAHVPAAPLPENIIPIRQEEAA